MKPLEKVHIEWTSEFAYGIGLLTTDGCLSSDGRHILFVSREQEMIDNFQKCFGLANKVRIKSSGFTKKKNCFVVQFGDVRFYRFLLTIGLMPNKSKVLGEIRIPSDYMKDFLRGHLDGDGSFYSYWDKRWKSSFMFYTTFASASQKHIDWIRRRVAELIGIPGYISQSKNDVLFQLKYGKEASVALFRKLYYDDTVLCLARKRLKIENALSVNQQHAEIA